MSRVIEGDPEAILTQSVAISLSHSGRNATYGHQRYETVARLVTSCTTPTFPFPRSNETTPSSVFTDSNPTGHP